MKRFCVAVFVVLAMAGPLTTSASAHGHRMVGDIEWTVGWADEPAFVGFKNGVQLFLTRGPQGPPVEGAEKDLEVVVSIGSERTEPLELRTVFEAPGEYRADLIPTVPGDYTFRFMGTLEGEAIDESFIGSKDEFSQIEGTTDIAFPKAAPSNAELAERLEDAEDTAADAKGSLGTARVIALIAAVLALGAIVLGMRSRRTSA